MTKHKYTLTVETTRWQVEVSPSTNYGWFQDLRDGTEGGLWFKNGELIDYDGVYCLPRFVGQVLHAMGYQVDPASYAYDHALTDEELSNGRFVLENYGSNVTA